MTRIYSYIFPAIVRVNFFVRFYPFMWKFRGSVGRPRTTRTPVPMVFSSQQPVWPPGLNSPLPPRSSARAAPPPPTQANEDRGRLLRLCADWRDRWDAANAERQVAAFFAVMIVPFDLSCGFYGKMFPPPPLCSIFHSIWCIIFVSSKCSPYVENISFVVSFICFLIHLFLLNIQPFPPIHSFILFFCLIGLLCDQFSSKSCFKKHRPITYPHFPLPFGECGGVK